MEFNSGSMRDQQGALWFGGTHGVTVLENARLQANTHPPAVEITGVEVMSEALTPEAQTFTGETIELSHRDRSISFEFVALDFAAPSSNRYRYMLEGFDQDWIANGTRDFTTYTNLPAGSYTFRVDGSNNDGVWSGDPAELRITVARPLYARWWAFAGYAALLVLVALVVLRLRDRRLLKAQVAQLHDQRTRLEDDNRLLGRMSITDPLTNIYNRRYFDWRISDSWTRAQRSGWSLSLLIIDIDYFKLFNDSYGHPEGDAALREVARVITERVSRASDVVARYGGEEFAVLLHGVDDPGAGRVAENIRRSVEEVRIPHDASAVSDVLTVSIGICTVRPEAGGSAKTLLAGADRALYEGKQAGRNTIRSCDSRSG
jgi:diguanylate cyclase (GGDEF)-like protein